MATNGSSLYLPLVLCFQQFVFWYFLALFFILFYIRPNACFFDCIHHVLHMDERFDLDLTRCIMRINNNVEVSTKSISNSD